MRRRRRRLVALIYCLLSVALISQAATPAAVGARPRTFVAGCGNLESLEIEPELWSYGCTSGTPTIESLDWLSYRSHRAVATGVALVQNCGCYDPTEFARYPGRLVLTRPRRCADHRGWRYFFAVRLTITYPDDNPFGKPAGKVTQTFHPWPGECGIGPG
jgi:hypothetical protein